MYVPTECTYVNITIYLPHSFYMFRCITHHLQGGLPVFLSLFIDNNIQHFKKMWISIEIWVALPEGGVFFFWRNSTPPSPQGARASSFTMFLDHTPQSVGLLWTRDQPVAETPTWQHTQTHQTDINAPQTGFEAIISAGKRPQIHATNRAATGTGEDGV